MPNNGERVKCPRCGEEKSVAKRPGIRMARCEGCGFDYVVEVQAIYRFKVSKLEQHTTFEINSKQNKEE